MARMRRPPSTRPTAQQSFRVCAPYKFPQTFRARRPARAAHAPIHSPAHLIRGTKGSHSRIESQSHSAYAPPVLQTIHARIAQDILPSSHSIGQESPRVPPDSTTRAWKYVPSDFAQSHEAD